MPYRTRRGMGNDNLKKEKKNEKGIIFTYNGTMPMFLPNDKDGNHRHTDRNTHEGFRCV